MVPNNEKAEVYLGAPISTTTGSYEFLIEKFSSKLQVWKGRLLSQAGRLTLLKSVLQALPIYHMATAQIPNGVIKTLTKLMRRFFWGAGDKDRFLSYVAWDRLTVPFTEGGLGLRELGQINNAMMMKALWKLAAEQDVPWVNLVTAKYLPRSELWNSKRMYSCTVFWRGVLKLRGSLLPLIAWNLGDGEKCKAYSQPWFPGSMDLKPQNGEQRNQKVKEFMLIDGRGWDMEKLIQNFGYHNCLQIIDNVDPPSQIGTIDRLISKLTENGSFSVKKAYHFMSERGVTNQSEGPSRELWRAIWRKGNVVPRVRLFVWKLINKALPLGGILQTRISSGDPSCAVCGAPHED